MAEPGDSCPQGKCKGTLHKSGNPQKQKKLDPNNPGTPQKPNFVKVNIWDLVCNECGYDTTYTE